MFREKTKLFCCGLLRTNTSRNMCIRGHIWDYEYTITEQVNNV